MSLYEEYKSICYSMLGKRIDEKGVEEMSRMLYQADINMTPGMFISMAIVTAVLASIPVLIFSLIVFGVSWYTYTLVSVTLLVVVGTFMLVLYNSISNKKTGIEKELPFALAYMSILASAGSTPLEIFRRIAIEDYGDVSREFRKLIYHIDVLGEDEISAMSDLANNTPSEIFRGIVIDLSNVVYSGSGMKDYLEAKSRDLMSIKRQAQREFVDSLSIYGEMYLGGILMMMIMTVIGIVLCGALNVDIGPFKPGEAFVFFVYLIVPLISVIFYLMLEMKYSRIP